MEKQVIKDALWVDVGDLTVLRNGRIFKRNWNHTGKTKEVKQTLHRTGYLQIRHKGKDIRSHRLLAKAFISNPDNLPQINHKDEVKDHNDVFNLEWCDAKYNINYGTHTERVAKSRSKKVYQYTLDGTFIREWPSTREVERQLGVANSNIAKCCNGKLKSVYGFHWSYTPLH